MAQIYRQMFCEGRERPMQISGILGSSGGDLEWTTYLGEFRIHRASSQDVEINGLFHTLKQIV